MRKRKGTLVARRSYRVPKTDLKDLENVLRVINGEVRRPERYEPQRSMIRDIFDKIIGYCDHIEEMLSGLDYFNGVPLPYVIPKRDRIARVLNVAYSSLYRIFDLDPVHPVKFTVRILPDRGSKGRKERENWNSKVLPPAEELFRVTNLFMYPDGNVGVWLHWWFYQGIVQLNDLRRLRRCSGSLHDGPHYFLRKKVERMEHWFCSDQCRSDFNYKKSIEEKANGDQRKTPKSRR
jgi:hypothetical protein